MHYIHQCVYYYSHSLYLFHWAEMNHDKTMQDDVVRADYESPHDLWVLTDERNDGDLFENAHEKVMEFVVVTDYVQVDGHVHVHVYLHVYLHSEIVNESENENEDEDENEDVYVYVS